MVRLGYDAIGTAWREVPLREAEIMLAHRVGHDLAYGRTQLQPTRTCEAAAAELIAHAGAQPRAFVSHSQSSPDQSSYTMHPVRKDWTFSQAFVLVGSARMVVACFLAED